MFDSALILGNGASREQLDLSVFIGKSSIYGCNLAYKESIPFEWIVSTDPLAQHGIYRNYKGNCLFLDWKLVPSEIAVSMLGLDAYATPDVNEYTNNGCVISGEGEQCVYTYLDAKDEVSNVSFESLPFPMASGTLAMWDAAEKGFKTIYLAGMGDFVHLHNQHLMDDDGYRLAEWEEQRMKVIDMHPQINWIYL